MSVLKSKRSESNVQFLTTARELEIFTLKKSLKIPKRYTKLFTEYLAHLSFEIYNNVKMANAIFNDTKDKIERRTYYLDNAMRNLYCLISQIDIAKELLLTELSDYAWMHWMELIDNELTLIKALKVSDADKLKKL
jgi:hypothetical protein